MTDISEGIQFRLDGVDPTQWPKLSCSQANQAALELSDLRLDVQREILFQGNGQLRASGDILFITGGTAPEKLRILANGNVGIGTSSPAYNLDVNGILNVTEIYKNGAPWTLTNNEIADNAISATKIQDGSVGQAELSVGAVTELKIANSAVTEAKLANNAVTTAKIADGAVTQAKLEPSARSQWSSSSSSIYYNGGNVGIGTITPATARLEVAGTVKATSFQGDGSTLDGVVKKAGDTMTGALTINNALTVNGNINFVGTVKVNGQTVIDSDASWHRSYGNAGWYNGTYGGGWYMTDSTWIRSYGGKNIYHDTGILRTDGILQVGPNGNRFVVDTSGIELSPAGSNSIRFTSGWSSFPDGSLNRAEISNDTGTYKTLMIVGNRSGGFGRRVSIWDRLEVNGQMSVSGGVIQKGGSPVTSTQDLGLYSQEPGYWMRFVTTPGSGGVPGFWFFCDGGGGNRIVAQIDGNGRYTQSSSWQYKENIEVLSNQDAFKALEELNPVLFNYKLDDKKKRHVGFIAEELPHLVADPKREMLSPTDIIAVLTKVVKEQQNTIAALTERVQALEMHNS